jgi:NitT/TauT family transport system ATP-binding protein
MPENGTTLLNVQHIGKQYGDLLAVKDVTFDVREGEFISIVGPSGCGKTTLLKMICGLLEPSSGQIEIHEQQVTTSVTEMILVFQDYSRSLFPWLTVGKNVLFPLKNRSDLNSAEKERRAQEAIQAVGLEDSFDQYPWQLSGGMQQRVAIARAIAFRPEILLLDEPFASVDALTRAELEDLVLRLQAKFKITVLLVTHDIDEAVYLAERVFVLGPPPSVVVRTVPVKLPSPRSQTETRSDPRFLEIRNEIHDLITKEAQDTKDIEEENTTEARSSLSSVD